MSNARTLAGLIDDTNTRIKIPSGYGLDFADYGAEDSNSNTTVGNNLMDDYEEGFWTPNFTNHTSANVTQNNGYYRKIGDLVFIWGRIEFNSFVSAYNLILLGVPFLPSNNTGYDYANVITVHDTNGTDFNHISTYSTGQNFFFYNNFGNGSNNPFGASGAILFSGSYLAD